MAMTFRERLMAVLNGEEPDKTPICANKLSMTGESGGWMRRLNKRGMGVRAIVPVHRPAYYHPLWINPYLEDVKYIQVHYVEKGVKKFRHTFETPIGSITGVERANPGGEAVLAATEEHFVKQTSDWRIVNYIFQGILDNLAPDYEPYRMLEDELGEDGLVMAAVGKTPYQRAWVEFATPERAIIDFKEQPEELQEYIETQRKLHDRIAEICAESPAKIINIHDHVTVLTPPYYFQDYCAPIYKVYHDLFEGTGKLLGNHMDGLFGHLKKEIGESVLDICESFTAPPTGDVTLTEVKELWPGKIVFLNTPPHLALAEPDEVRKGYQAIAEEWGSKKGLLIEYSEHLPAEKVEAHLSAALDAFGYD